MSDATRMRAMELRWQADEVERHADLFGEPVALADVESDPALFAAALLVTWTAPPLSVEEMRMRAAARGVRS